MSILIMSNLVRPTNRSVAIFALRLICLTHWLMPFFNGLLRSVDTSTYPWVTTKSSDYQPLSTIHYGSEESWRTLSQMVMVYHGGGVQRGQYTRIANRFTVEYSLKRLSRILNTDVMWCCDAVRGKRNQFERIKSGVTDHFTMSGSGGEFYAMVAHALWKSGPNRGPTL